MLVARISYHRPIPASSTLLVSLSPRRHASSSSSPSSSSSSSPTESGPNESTTDPDGFPIVFRKHKAQFRARVVTALPEKHRPEKQRSFRKIRFRESEIWERGSSMKARDRYRLFEELGKERSEGADKGRKGFVRELEKLVWEGGEGYRVTTVLTKDGREENKTRVLTDLEKCIPDAPATEGQRPFDAALILASPSLTSWLDDTAFVGQLLEMTSRVKGIVPEEGISVLSAVVEGLVVRLKRKGATGNALETRQGVAVVQGYADEMLPGLWDAAKKHVEDGGRGQVQGQQKAGLVFRVPGWERRGLEGEERAMQVTVPVANTVFQNGRTSTLFASRWEKETASGQLTETERVDLRTGVVNVPTAPGDVAAVTGPLVSITPLRTVHAALGNILKTFYFDGAEVPASRELEANVPKLLEWRSRMGLREIQGPLDVWAVIVPARLGNDLNFAPLKMLPVQRLLREGCRVHRVLSGGGGWGAKQGLLSLDPEARFETSDEEDVERFERDFMARQTGGDGGGSVVGPGDRVVFCVDTKTYPKLNEETSIATKEQERMSERFAIKVMRETVADRVSPPQRFLRNAYRADDIFGVRAPEMFVAPAGAGAAVSDGGVVESMKVDTPGARLSVGQMAFSVEDDLVTSTEVVTDESSIRDETVSFDTLLQLREEQWEAQTQARVQAKGQARLENYKKALETIRAQQERTGTGQVE